MAEKEVKIMVENPTVAPAECFSWNNVCLSIPIKKEKPKVILQDITGKIKAGQVVAIMGGSGAGKSSMLNTLAGRISNNSILSGDILVDGKERDPGNWKLQCAYVEQDDVLFPNLTVFETLSYSAMLRLPSTVSAEEKLFRVNKVISELGLEGCRNTRIGNSISRGISGGERKRVSIGIELVTNPQILFLDEPTSGLDAFNAFNAMETIQKLAKKERKIVLLTIHQPRTDILNLFDSIILLSNGQLLWDGPSSDAIEHFSKLGYPLPPNTNPSDFFLDVITIDRRTPELLEQSSARIEKFTAAFKERSREGTVVHKTDTTNKGCAQYPSTWISEVFILADRFLKNEMRDPVTIGATLGSNIFMMVVLCALYNNVGNGSAGIQNRIGAFFFMTLNLTFGIIGPSVGKFPEDKAMIKRERAAGSYRSSAAYLARIISSLPLLFLGTIVFVVPSYWAIGFGKTPGQFFTYLAIFAVQAICANNLGFVIGAISPNAQAGQVLTPVILVVFMLFSGLLVNLDTITPALRWIQWASLISYTYKMLVQNEFISTLTFTCQPGAKCYSNGLEVIKDLALADPPLWTGFAINSAFVIFYMLLGMLIFHRTSAPLEKLK